MATTVVYPSLDVSGTGSISTLISTAGTFAGSLTASSLTVTGTATFSGTAVFVGPAQFLASVTFSAGVSFLGTASFSATVAFANATVTTLGVGGTASFSTAVQIAGFPAGSVLLGSLSISVNNSIRFSGSWSDYAILELHAFFKATPSGSVNFDIYTDGGTTSILPNSGLGSATISFMFVIGTIYNGTAFKATRAARTTNAVINQAATATANTAATVNCLQLMVGTSLTLSSGLALLYGRRR